MFLGASLSENAFEDLMKINANDKKIVKRGTLNNVPPYKSINILPSYSAQLH